MARLTAAQMSSHYGRPRSFAPTQVQSRLPWTPRRTDGRVQVVLAHPHIVDLFVDACNAAANQSTWVPQRIDSYVPRPIRGYKKPKGWQLGDKGTSSHSWSTAFDFFATKADVPPPGGVWTPHNGVPPEFAAAFEQRGFTWGGKWRRKDTPHIEFRGMPPKTTLRDSPDDYVDYLTGLLKQGDTGPDVKWLQYALRAVGHPVQPTGIFDSATHGGVEAVQRATNSTVDGLVGDQTERALWDLMWIVHPTPEAMVTAAFADVLGRGVEPSAMKHYTGVLSDGLNTRKFTPPNLWAILWDSDEAKARRAKATTVTPAPPTAPVPPPVDPGTQTPAPLPPSPPEAPPSRYSTELAAMGARLTAISETI